MDLLELSSGGTEDKKANKTNTLMLFGPKGGLGKTTLSEHLCVSAARAGLKVLAVDFDPQMSLSRWYHARGKNPEIANLAKFDCERWSVKAWVDLWDKIPKYDLVILDMPPSLDGYENTIFELTSRVDLIIIPTGVAKHDWEIVIEWSKRFRERGLKNIRVVINKVVDYKRRSFLNVQHLLSQFCTLVPAVIPHREDVFGCTDRGLTVVEIPKAMGHIEFDMLWQTIKNELEIEPVHR